MQKIPKTGFSGLVENWQSDLIAAVSVSLVALPLALGIAYASNVPPMAGVVSAIIGGVVTTFFRGSHVAINGPAAGLIAVILSSLALWSGDEKALNYVLAAIVVSGGIQILLGILKLGKFAEIFHSSVIHGILAAIGIIIFAKQIHVAMGTSTEATGTIDTLVDAVQQIPNINPFVVTISLAGLLLLIFQSKISYKLFHAIPAPMWVLVISIPFVYFFNFFDTRLMNFMGNNYEVGPHLLIDIPNNIMDAITHPDFSQIHTWKFWSSVISITMIASIESLASSKAVDKLDPYKRKTNLNKDLIGIGLSTMVSGALGGLPIITVIVRSTVNVHNHAKTRWSNLYHGILLVLFIFVLTPVITKVPLASLAILLVFTGYKLASPKVFKHVYDQGIEQLVFFIGTLMITLFTDLLIGIFGGLTLAMLTHFLLAKVSIPQFFQMIFNSGSNLFMRKDGAYDLKIQGIANFLGAIKMDKLLDQVPSGTKVYIDLSSARLVDFSILEKLYDFERTHSNNGGEVKFGGLEKHVSSNNHKLGLKLLTSSAHKLTNREKGIKEVAEKYSWNYQTEPVNHIDYYEPFYFFQSRPIEYKTNCIWSKDKNMKWEITDVTFEEGAYVAYQEYKMTLGIIRLPFEIPEFIIERNEFFERYLSGHKNIDYETYTNFSDNFSVKVKDKAEMDVFMTDELKVFIENSNIPHMESNGKAILIFPSNFRVSRIHEYSKIIKFMNELRALINKSSLRTP
ncbi:MAG: MFS superfamily sulfate permease-like transporter [Saprospiraceae bacterium]|jgi:MFS superfamily sulfate permease-like transporter